MPDFINNIWEFLSAGLEMTERRNTVYIQLVIVLFIFYLGLPTLLFQVSASDNLKRIIRRYWWKIPRRIIAPPYLYITVGGWYFLSILILVFGVRIIVDPSNVSHRWFADTIIVICVVFSLILSLILWYYSISWERLVRALGKLAYRYEKLGAWMPGEHKQLKESVVKDIVYLGEFGMIVSQKEAALRALEDVAQVVQRDPTYNGAGLESIHEGIERIVLSASDRFNERLFTLALDILGAELQNDRSLESWVDERDALTTLGRLGAAVIEAGAKRLAMDYLDEIYDYEANGEKTFAIGRIALASNEYLVALQALSYLEELRRKAADAEEKKERLYHFLALLSFFWSKQGTARQEARKRLDEIRDRVDFGQPEFIINTLQFFKSSANYDTVDNLRTMMKEYKDLDADRQWGDV